MMMRLLTAAIAGAKWIEFTARCHKWNRNDFACTGNPGENCLHNAPGVPCVYTNDQVECGLGEARDVHDGYPVGIGSQYWQTWEGEIGRQFSGNMKLRCGSKIRIRKIGEDGKIRVATFVLVDYGYGVDIDIDIQGLHLLDPDLASNCGRWGEQTVELEVLDSPEGTGACPAAKPSTPSPAPPKPSPTPITPTPSPNAPNCDAGGTNCWGRCTNKRTGEGDWCVDLCSDFDKNCPSGCNCFPKGAQTRKPTKPSAGPHCNAHGLNCWGRCTNKFAGEGDWCVHQCHQFDQNCPSGCNCFPKSQTANSRLRRA